ncbi:hypothetical protein MUG84_09970 [Paenibacillus sp. KQZ6P-2]|uniref:DUF5050 domain-containing protein n=1 Tax=Paenibacillus mangrovi TaxID=2931978 RepID=A0A9X1WNC8_9BACL|nr:hypothetical protein [Paenibacillus mangrovi]MCJ8012069.1 hypothetical protein [Paenibacillus mangrovi]
MSLLRKLITIISAVIIAGASLLGALPGQAAAASDPFAAYHKVFKKGPTIPNLDTHYVPQGMTYYPAKNWILISYYYHNKSNDSLVKDSLIAVVDAGSGKFVKNVYLSDEKQSGGISHSGHVGGMGVSKSYLWIASSASTADTQYNMLRYKLSDVSAAKNNSHLKLNKGYKLKASSYATVADGDLYVGKFDEKNSSYLYRYDLNSSENPSASPIATYKTPAKVQGVAVTGSNLIFSASYGRNNPGYLYIYTKAASPKLKKTMKIPNMSEDLAIINGNLYINFESGAKYYSNSSYVKKTLSYAKLSSVL